MDTTLALKVRESGFKMKYLADQIGVSSVYFYMCMGGKRTMDRYKQEKLKELLGLPYKY